MVIIISKRRNYKWVSIDYETVEGFVKMPHQIWIRMLSHYLFIIKIPILRYIYFDLHIMMLLAVMTLHTLKRIKDMLICW